MAPTNTVPKTLAMQIVEEGFRRYGQPAFGLFVLFVCWRYMLEPVYKDAKTDSAVMQAMVETLHTTAEVQNQSARALQEAAKSLSETAARFERLTPH